MTFLILLHDGHINVNLYSYKLSFYHQYYYNDIIITILVEGLITPPASHF